MSGSYRAGRQQRVDGPAKVTGSARYSGEIALPDLAYAEIVGAGIASGRITSIDTGRAERADGVAGILTHRNLPKVNPVLAAAVTDRRSGTGRDVLPDAGRRGPLRRPARRDRRGGQPRAGPVRRDAGQRQLRTEPFGDHHRPGPRRCLRTAETVRWSTARADAARERRRRAQRRRPADRRGVPVRRQSPQPDRVDDDDGGLGWRPADSLRLLSGHQGRAADGRRIARDLAVEESGSSPSTSAVRSAAKPWSGRT